MAEQCWLGGQCSKETKDCGNCVTFTERFARVVYCKVKECLWYEDIPFSVYVAPTKDYTPLGEEDAYRGVCGRATLGIAGKVIETSLAKHNLAVCKLRSDKRITGHLDFSKFPTGGNIG